MKKWIFLLGFLLLAASAVFAGDFLAKKQVKIGQPPADFTLQDLRGQNVSLASLRGKTVVLFFWSAKCPFIVRYEKRLQAIASDFSSKGVAVFGIDSNANDSKAEIEKAAKEHKVNYPILLDPGNIIADQFGAVTTPHAFILDKQGILVYEGAVDNQGWSESKKPTAHYVREALEALVADKFVRESKTRTFGCTIKRK